MPLTDLGNALVGAGTAVAGSVATTSIGNSRKAKLAKYSYEKDLEMWNRQNLYNSPDQQMARLKKAGLNPNLVYGTGSVTGNTGSQMPKYQTPQHQNIEAPDTTQILGAYSQQKMLPLQVDQAKATIRKTIAEADNKNIDSITKKHRASKEGVSAKYAEEMAKYSLQASKSTAEGKQLDVIHKKYREALNKQGLHMSDPWIMRQIENKSKSFTDWLKKHSKTDPVIQEYIKNL